MDEADDRIGCLPFDNSDTGAAQSVFERCCHRADRGLGLLPRDLSAQFAQLEPYGPIILIVLIALPFLTGGQVGILFEVMEPIIKLLANLFAGVRGDEIVG